MLERALGLPLEEVTAALNDPRMLTGIAPAVNIVTTSGEHAMFYDMLRRGGAIDGVRVFETATIRRAIAEQNWFEPDLTLGIPMRYSLGFMLGRKVVSFFGPNTEHAFGHNGYTNIVGWADPQRRVAAALMTSGKPILGTHLLDFLAVPREIAHQCPADGLEESPLHRF
jgi:CubicO group peptidase (beta-lactamase class C family)